MLTMSAPTASTRALTFAGLVETLREAFRAGAVQPVRHHHTIERPDGAASTLLLMPAWTDFSAATRPGNGHIGVKVVTVSPDNNALGKPAVMGLYLLLDGRTGEPQALIDGQRLTQWRTACASALAASYLARQDASRLLVIGAGALCPFLAKAHSAVRPIQRNPDLEPHAGQCRERRPKRCRKDGLDASAVSDLDAALGEADIVSSRDDLRQPAGQGRAAQARRACRPGRRLHAAHAREPTTTPSVARASMSTHAPAPPRKPATSCSRWPRVS